MHGKAEPGSPGSLREANRNRVIEALRELGVASRAEIARRTGLSRTTVSTIVADLRQAGLVVEQDGDGPPIPGAQGRPPTMIALHRSAGVAVGIDFGKRHLAVAIADPSHEILAEEKRELPDDYEAQQALDAAAALVEESLAAVGAVREDVLGVGLGVPGPIHLATETVGSSSILPGWVGLHPASEMTRRLALPVHVENDANLGALAELTWGAGRGCRDLVYLKVSTGIGAGLVIGGQLFRGAGGTAGEIGHTTIDETGDICRCGNRGCLETMAGAAAIAALLERSRGGEIDAERFIELALAGDTGCRRAIADAGRHIGVAVANLCNLFNPERIVVGGAVGVRTGELLIEPLRDSVRLRAIPTAAEDVEIVPGRLGERAELLGAVALVLHRGGSVPRGAQGAAAGGAG